MANWNTRRIVSKVTHSLRTRGVLGTVSAAYCFLRRHRRPVGASFDAHSGVDTAGSDPLFMLVDNPDAVAGGYAYEPSDEEDVERALRTLKIDFSAHDFIDIGCGKGKALLIASKFSFRRLVGVEFIKVLADVAKANLQRKGIDNAVVLNADARDFSFPASPTVVFMYNPFGPEVLNTVIRNLIDAHTAEQIVIYSHALHHRVLEEFGVFKLISRFPNKPVGKAKEEQKPGTFVDIWIRASE